MSIELVQTTDQEGVIAAMSREAFYPHHTGGIELIETHAALVFLAGDHVYKIKKAVRYPYMDLSTLEKRHRVCQREHELNSPAAPEIYLGLIPITREPDGSLRLGGNGTPVEWAVHMRRFPQDCVLSPTAAHSRIPMRLIKSRARVIADAHLSAPVAHEVSGTNAMGAIVDELADAFSDFPEYFDPEPALIHAATECGAGTGFPNSG